MTFEDTDEVVCNDLPPHYDGCGWTGKATELVNGCCPTCDDDANLALVCPFCGSADSVDDDRRICSYCLEPF